MSFHRWISTDGDEDQCIGCGTVASDAGEGGVADHGPLPFICPGPVLAQPHHFVRLDSDVLVCGYCTYEIHGGTQPNEVGWNCSADR